MAKFTGKNNFANGDTITATSLNDITDTLLLASDSFSNTFTVNTGVVTITNGAITTDLLETSTDENTGISTEKIQYDFTRINDKYSYYKLCIIINEDFYNNNDNK